MSRDKQSDKEITDPVGASPLSAYVRVTSVATRLSQIIKVMDIESNDSHDIGDPNPYRENGCYQWSLWTLPLAIDETTSMGTIGLSQAIVALGDDLADRLARLGGKGCEVSLIVVQEFERDYDDFGIHLTASAIRWLARAGAFLDVDQYLYCEDGRILGA